MDLVECGLHTDCHNINEVCLRGTCTIMKEASPCRDVSQTYSCPAGLVCYTSQGRCRDLSRTPLDLALPYIHPNSLRPGAPTLVESRDCPIGSYADVAVCRPLAMSGEQCTETTDCVETNVCHRGKCAQTCLASAQCLSVAGNETCINWNTLQSIHQFATMHDKAGGVCMTQVVLAETKWSIDRANSINPIKCSLDSDCDDPLCSCYHGSCSKMTKGTPCRTRNGKAACPGHLECDQGLCRDRSDNTGIYANCQRGTADVPGDDLHCRVLGGTDAACTGSAECLESHICYKLKCVQVCFETSECTESKPESKKLEGWTCYNPYLEQTNISRSNNGHGGGICQFASDLKPHVRTSSPYNASYMQANSTRAKDKVSAVTTDMAGSTLAMIAVVSIVGLIVFIFVIFYIRKRRRERTLRLYF